MRFLSLVLMFLFSTGVVLAQNERLVAQVGQDLKNAGQKTGHNVKKGATTSTHAVKKGAMQWRWATQKSTGKRPFSSSKNKKT